MMRATKATAPKYVRTFASEKQLRMKIASTTNIAKITSSMKMVAAAKMRGDEARLNAGKTFGRIFARALTPPEGFVAPEGRATVAVPKKTLVRFVVWMPRQILPVRFRWRCSTILFRFRRYMCCTHCWVGGTLRRTPAASCLARRRPGLVVGVDIGENGGRGDNNIDDVMLC